MAGVAYVLVYSGLFLLGSPDLILPTCFALAAGGMVLAEEPRAPRAVLLTGIYSSLQAAYGLLNDQGEPRFSLGLGYLAAGLALLVCWFVMSRSNGDSAESPTD